MKLVALILAAVLCSPALGACCASTATSQPESTPEQIRKQNEEGFRRSALERAAFDLRCEKDALRIRALNAFPGLGAQIGAECDGRRMVYVYKQVGAMSASWVAESASHTR